MKVTFSGGSYNRRTLDIEVARKYIDIISKKGFYEKQRQETYKITEIRKVGEKFISRAVCERKLLDDAKKTVTKILDKQKKILNDIGECEKLDKELEDLRRVL